MYITATGMICPVGLTAASACAAMRTGIDGFNELPYIDNQGNPIMGAAVPVLDPLMRYRDRVIQLLCIAVEDCLSNSSLARDSLKYIPLLVGLAEPDRPGTDPKLADSIIAEVQQNLGVQFHPQFSKTFPKGHTAGFEAVREAAALIANQGVSQFLIAAADSYLNARSLLWLDQHWRLKTEENSDGVIPGEAGTAVILSRDPLKSAPCHVRITGLGFGFEKAHVLTDEPLLGLGLAQAVRIALNDARLQMHEIDFRISDVTGESYGFREQALTLGRVMRTRREELPIWHSADSIGDIGAAAGIAQLIIAQQAFLKDYAPGSQAACYCSAVLGERAATAIQRHAL